MRRYFALCAVVVVVVLAGCGGLTGGDDAGDGVEPADAGAAIELPDGYDEQGLTDVATAADAHDAGIVAADGLHVRVETSQAGDQSFTLEQRQWIDRERDVARTESTSTESERQSYQTEDGTVYIRDEGPDSVRYRAEDERLDDIVPDVRNFLSLVEDAPFQHERTTHQETPVIAYDLDGDATTTIDGQTFDLDGATLIVDGEGRIHTLSITAITDEVEQSITVEFEYGPVDIEEPDWLDEAIEATEDDF